MCPETPFGAARLTVVTDERVRDTQERARVAGYAAGFAAGSRAAAEATQTLHTRLRAEAQAAEAARQSEHRAALRALAQAGQAAQDRVVPVLDASRSTLHSLALELARAVLGHDLADGDLSAAAALARARAVPQGVDVQTVRLHPQDLAAVERAGLDRAGLDHITLVADPTLAPGDAVSTFEGGYLDARIAGALDRALAALQDTTPTSGTPSAAEDVR